MKKPRIPNTKPSPLFSKLFSNEFHPYISVFHAGVYLRFTKPPYGDMLRVRKLGCSAISFNGITFRVPENEMEAFIPPVLTGSDSVVYPPRLPRYSNVSRVVEFEYRVPDGFKNATFEYQGNTYEVF